MNRLSFIRSLVAVVAVFFGLRSKADPGQFRAASKVCSEPVFPSRGYAMAFIGQGTGKCSVELKPFVSKP